MGDRRASIKIEFSMHGETKKADMWINWSSDYNGVDQRVLDFFSKSARQMKEALAQPPEARNFCPRCGKRTADLTVIHTCTPPRGLENT
jgi:hypothetical protein